MKTAVITAAGRTATLMAEHCAITVGSLFAALYTRAEIIAVIGTIAAATGFCGLLGLFLSEAIPAMRIAKIEGNRRLIANWCAGGLAYWTAPVVQDAWLPGHDIELVAAICAAVQSLLGVMALVVLMKVAAKRVAPLIEDELDRRLGGGRKPKPTDKPE